MGKTALITGVLGQDGAYLAKFLLEKGYTVHGLSRRTSRPNYENVDHLGIRGEIDYALGDMTDPASLISAVRNVKPDEIYNLAAQSFVGASWDQPITTCEINGLGVVHLLNSFKHETPSARFYQASTSELFGNNSSGDHLNEESPMHPRSPYGFSKLMGFWATRNYRESFALHASNGILFNHESPIRGREFVTRKITEGVAKIKLGLEKKITLGNLDAKRDWGFAGDYVEAMWLMLQQPQPDDFVIATGRTHSIRDFLSIAFNHAGLGDWQDYVTTDPANKRPAEVHALRGDASKARRILGWEPKITFEKLVEMMVESDIQKLNSLRR